MSFDSASHFDWQMWLFAALAFIYSSMIMLTVIVTLSKSARLSGQKKGKSS